MVAFECIRTPLPGLPALHIGWKLHAYCNSMSMSLCCPAKLLEALMVLPRPAQWHLNHLYQQSH